MFDFVLPDIPKEAYSPFEWPEYHLPLVLHSFTKPQLLNTTPLGARWRLGPVVFDEYRTLEEPRSPDGKDPSALLHIQLWRPPFILSNTKHWWHMPGKGADLYIGIHNDLTPDYAHRWKSRLRNYANKFRSSTENGEYEIIPISYASFAEAFARSTVARDIPTLELAKLSERLRLFPDRVRIWGVRRIEDGAIVAGINIFNSPRNQASHYGCGFYLPEVSKNHFMVALMDHWFADSVTQGIRVMHLGLFLPPGIKTFGRELTISNFKGQFVTDYIRYPTTRFRFIWKKNN